MSSYGQSSKAGNKSKRHGNDQELDYAEDDQGSGSHRKGWKGTLNSFFSEPAGFYHTVRYSIPNVTYHSLTMLTQEPQTSQYQKQQPEVLRKQAPPAQPERRGTDQGIHKMPVERDAWGRVSEKDKELQRRAEFIEGLKGHITQLMTKQHALEHELRQLQVASFKNIANAQYTPMDDVAIKLELGGIQRSITNIGKLYGADPGDMRDLHTRPLTERDQLHLDLCNVVYLQDAGRQELEEELVGQESAARVFLTGLLSFAVHNEIVSNPFFFLADDVNVKERPFLDAATVDWPQAFFKAYSREWLCECVHCCRDEGPLTVRSKCSRGKHVALADNSLSLPAWGREQGQSFATTAICRQQTTFSWGSRSQPIPERELQVTHAKGTGSGRIEAAVCQRLGSF